VTLSRLRMPRLAVDVSVEAAPTPNVALLRSVNWLLCFISFTALLLTLFSATIAALIFLVAATLPALYLPTRVLRALFSDWLPWLYVALAILSISWSQAPDSSAKFGIEFVLTVAGALTLASALQPHSFMSALMCAFLFADVLGLFVGRFAWNAGAFAMIGIFGSKNAFSAAQAYLFLASFWVLLSAKQNVWMRYLALASVLVCPFLLVAGRSADAVAPLLLAVTVTGVAYLTRRWPPLSRILAIFAGISLMIVIFGVAYIFWDTLFGQLLAVTGKEVTLSGRAYMWVRAAELIGLNPLLGTGYGAFWVQGNPYAEEIWAHFQVTGRGGFNFHNQWYDIGVALGYFGLAVAFLTVLTVSVRTLRWVIRYPSAESYFFLGFVWILIMRSFLESEIFSHFSISWILFVAAAYYGKEQLKHRHS
jgi:exopolysaccharide production protein ExoQ